jgi:FlaA1/EpsC-like NDP-sugar epimerase
VNNFIASLILAAVGIAVVIGVKHLHYKEMAVLQNGTLLPLYDGPIMNRESFQVFFDLGFILLSFILASLMVEPIDFVDPMGREFFRRIALVAAVQFIVFILSNQSKRTYQFFGIGDALAFVRTLMLAVLIAGLAEALLLGPFRRVDLIVLALDNFFLASSVIGLRLSYRALQYLSRKGPKEGKRVIIYGADSNGVLMLERILESNITNWIPVGFIDDEVSMEGKYLNGYPVFGGHWKLQKLLREKNINEVIICSENIQAEALKRVRKTVKENKISLKRMRILYEDYHEEKELKQLNPVMQADGSPSQMEMIMQPVKEEEANYLNLEEQVRYSRVSSLGAMVNEDFHSDS